MSRSRLSIIAVLLLLVWQGWVNLHSARSTTESTSISPTSRAASPAAHAPDDSSPDRAERADNRHAQPQTLPRPAGEGVPREVHDTLRLIASGGPFPYPRDGVVFGNFEKRLPIQPRGYYREYTVPTPGAKNRGARRIITGGTPPQVYYYTDDHYQHFRPIQGDP